MTQPNQSELERQVHKLFGDHQNYDGGYQSCYDGKWIDMTNEVCAVAAYITANYTPNSEVEQQVLKILKGVWNEAKETEGRTPDSHEAQLIKDIIEEMENARTNLKSDLLGQDSKRWELPNDPA